jgi:hypothetical protein
MHLGERDVACWAELRAWQHDDRLGVFVRRLRAAYEHGDRDEVRIQALRLLIDLPHDDSAARNLLHRLRDVGEYEHHTAKSSASLEEPQVSTNSFQRGALAISAFAMAAFPP